jgi:hypothetical protein
MNGNAMLPYTAEQENQGNAMHLAGDLYAYTAGARDPWVPVRTLMRRNDLVDRAKVDAAIAVALVRGWIETNGEQLRLTDYGRHVFRPPKLLGTQDSMPKDGWRSLRKPGVQRETQRKFPARRFTMS